MLLVGDTDGDAVADGDLEDEMLGEGEKVVKGV